MFTPPFQEGGSYWMVSSKGFIPIFPPHFYCHYVWSDLLASWLLSDTPNWLGRSTDSGFMLHLTCHLRNSRWLDMDNHCVQWKYKWLNLEFFNEEDVIKGLWVIWDYISLTETTTNYLLLCDLCPIMHCYYCCYAGYHICLWHIFHISLNNLVCPGFIFTFAVLFYGIP